MRAPEFTRAPVCRPDFSHLGSQRGVQPNARVWGCLESCIKKLVDWPGLTRAALSCAHSFRDQAGGRRLCSASSKGFPKSLSGVLIPPCSCLLFAALGPFLMGLRQFCSILLEAGVVKIDVGRLSSRGKKLCAQALAASLLCHGCWVPAKHPKCSAVLEALCSWSRRQGRDPTHSPAAQPLCSITPALPPGGLGQALGWLPSLASVPRGVRRCSSASSRGCGGGSFSGIGNTSISPGRQ